MRSPKPNRHNLPSSSIQTAWTSHLSTEESRKSFEAKLFNMANDPAIVRLLELVEKRRQELLRREQTIEAYDTPSWSHRQAHINGEIACLNYVSGLLAFAKGPKT